MSVTPHLSSVRVSPAWRRRLPCQIALQPLCSLLSLLFQARIEELEEELEAERGVRAKVCLAAAKHLPVSARREVELRSETDAWRDGRTEGRKEEGCREVRPVRLQPPMGVLCVDAAAASGHPKPFAPVIIKRARRGLCVFD